MADLAADTHAGALVAAARAHAISVMPAAGHLHGSTHLIGTVFGEDPRVLVLCAIAPYGGFLFPHEGNVGGGRGGAIGAGGCGAAGQG